MRSGNMPASDFNLSPEFTFGHGIRAYRSLPRVEQIFSNSARQNQAERPNDGLRSRSTSAIRHGRRASADLFAQQAVNIAAGVSAASDWPARVSRELVLMSLGGDNANPSSAPRGLDSLALQESNVSSTTQESVGRLSSSSPSHPVIPPLSPSVFASLGSPSDLAPASSPSLAAVSRSISYELLKAGDSHPNVNLPMTPQSQDINAPVASSSRISEPTAASALLPSFSIPAPPPNSFASPHFSSPTTSVESHGSSLSPPQYVKGKGKGRADEADATVLDHNQGQRASFSLPEPRSPRRLSGVIRTPSSGRRRRAIFSSPLPAIQSRPNSMALSQSFPVAETDHMGDLGPAPRPSSTATDGDAPPRRSVSQSSIPISALIKAHAPSVGRSSMYHMRDPHKPPRKLETGWALRFRAEDEEGSPRHAWLFYVAFVLFPLWWVASFLPTPKTRRVGTDAEKAVTLDDPQVEFGACSIPCSCADAKGEHWC
ncbi:hypothetical protein FA95DRAFT_876043 [Auriscalpium vulgare]|uniref:Uncharacterized protein n=1 Tax=Auriscalpium vulgare TaxID=40419 RepID=A0ACB8RZ82_9AGAM|nr:hypothetical protein FA95DRAFT_876043 [Auriscalpium vulgare]